MRRARPRSALIACAVAALVVTGCGKEEHTDEAKREGLGVEVGGLTYRVYITRQINPRDAEDRAYWQGPDAPPGTTYYGVFLSVCNEGKQPLTPVGDFTVVDNQGNTFKPLPLKTTNVFAYRPRLLTRNACVPEAGSTAATGPTGGSLLVFKIPVTSIENRPLLLQIQDEGPNGELQKGSIQLDL